MGEDQDEKQHPLNNPESLTCTAEKIRCECGDPAEQIDSQDYIHTCGFALGLGPGAAAG